MKNNGAVKGIISTVAGEYTVPQGYHDGSGKVSIDATEPVSYTHLGWTQSWEIIVGDFEEAKELLTEVSDTSLLQSRSVS